MKIEINSERDELIVDGVKINLQVLVALVHPNENGFYRFVHDDDVVTVQRFAPKSVEGLIEGPITYPCGEDSCHLERCHTKRRSPRRILISIRGARC